MSRKGRQDSLTGQSGSERALYRAAREKDLECIVAKRKYDPYLPIASWLKIRNPRYSQWAGREELFEHERRADPDLQARLFALKPATLR